MHRESAARVLERLDDGATKEEKDAAAAYEDLYDSLHESIHSLGEHGDDAQRAKRILAAGRSGGVAKPGLGARSAMAFVWLAAFCTLVLVWPRPVPDAPSMWTRRRHWLPLALALGCLTTHALRSTWPGELIVSLEPTDRPSWLTMSCLTMAVGWTASWLLTFSMAECVWRSAHFGYDARDRLRNLLYVNAFLVAAATVAKTLGFEVAVLGLPTAPSDLAAALGHQAGLFHVAVLFGKYVPAALFLLVVSSQGAARSSSRAEEDTGSRGARNSALPIWKGAASTLAILLPAIAETMIKLLDSGG